jgi:hypothetical protein
MQGDVATQFCDKKPQNWAKLKGAGIFLEGLQSMVSRHFSHTKVKGLFFS